MNYKKWIFSLLILLLFSSCAANVEKATTTAVVTEEESVSYDEYDEYDEYDDYKTVNDPFEKINREFFDFNIWLLTKVVKPLLITYDFVVPDFLQSILYNMADRFYDFTYLANSILQLDYKNSLKTVATFSLNMTFGFFSFFNVAEDLGVYREERTFAQTMGLYGIGKGPYLMVPFFGPYTFREGIGKLTDMATSPFSLNLVRFDHDYFSVTPFAVDAAKYIGKYGVDLDDVVNLYETFVEKSFDPYIFTRDAYIQNIDFKIKTIKEKL